MIKIKKPAKPPKVLREKGKVENKKNCAAYDRSPEDYKSGQKKFEFNAQNLWVADRLKMHCYTLNMENAVTVNRSFLR